MRTDSIRAFRRLTALSLALLLGSAGMVALGSRAAAETPDAVTFTVTEGDFDTNIETRIQGSCPEGSTQLAVELDIPDAIPLARQLFTVALGGMDLANLDFAAPDPNTPVNLAAGADWRGELDGTFDVLVRCTQLVFSPDGPPRLEVTKDWEVTNRMRIDTTVHQDQSITGVFEILTEREVTATTVTAQAEPTTVLAGDPFTVTATVEPAEVPGTFFLDGATEGVAAVDGAATFDMRAQVMAPGEDSMEQTVEIDFVPDDLAAYGPSSGTVTVTVTRRPQTYTVVDADGTDLGTEPRLEQGQRVTVTANGFVAESEVDVRIDAVTERIGTATADADGAAAFEYTVPTDLSLQRHELTFATDVHSVTVPFVVVAPGSGNDDQGNDNQGGDNEGSENEGGDNQGNDDEGNENEGGDSSGTDSSGTDGSASGSTGTAGSTGNTVQPQTTGGTGSSTSGSATGGSGGGALANTGTSMTPVGIGALLLVAFGAAFVFHSRRMGTWPSALGAGRD
ncbi:hypothetical protein [Allostreptomyces psammosilenae]|uniref:Uncharacterized protein n=1 Tax=Allostreptomyces psammosilenae TaxID=1892865 RepID=A0A853A034_9ACTN|nr:hypothetical protein [Allostreptomyces psammosilenae]NYI06284.1 hypothetical protein [Allostreptomyces psammosilenae]